MIKFLKPLAILALLGFPIAVVLYRLNLLAFPNSFNLIKYSLILAIVVFFLSMVASFIMRKNKDKAHTARMAALIAILPIIGIGSQIFVGSNVPYIHNISTDTINPPVFDKVVSLRNEQHNSLAFEADKVIDEKSQVTLAQAQNSAYPNVQTHFSELSLLEAHAKAKSVAESLGWELVNSDPAAGIIEATQTTMIWGFKDDVVVRITVTPEGKSAVDLHSVSRIGASDLGANAKRIEAFLNQFKG
jgi:uncharacterized protein (DUF1499 family)